MGIEHGLDPMTTHGLVALDDASGLDGDELGAKAARLAQLRADGRPVPEGMVLCASFLRGADRAARQAAAVAIVDRLGPGPLAVRSSAVAEDRADASFAGLYETVLDVVGPEAVLAAIDTVVASASSARVEGYDVDAAGGAIAVLVQPMVPAECAGVAFGADPLTGDRGAVVISAVRGLGDALVSGEVDGEDWVVDDAGARPRSGSATALCEAQARSIAALARELSEVDGTPQDIEWAIAGGRLHLLQARPMTALPERVTWTTDAKGPFWRRDFRMGEWLPDPVTPLFETWFLPEHGRGFRQLQIDEYGGGLEPPYNIVVNGWCYSGIGRPGVRTAAAFLRHPIFVCKWGIAFEGAMKGKHPSRGERWMALPAWEIGERVGAAYRAAVERAESRVGALELAGLPALVDDLVRHFGALTYPLVECVGFAWKAEFALARLYDEQLPPVIGGTHQELLAGLREPVGPAPHSVVTLDWSQPTLGERGDLPSPPSPQRHAELRAARTAAEARCRDALAPGARRAFDERLALAQRWAVRREDFLAEFTLAWPVMRATIGRLGQDAVERGAIDDPADVYWLTRAEIDDLVAGRLTDRRAAIGERRGRWERQRRLVPPTALGKPGPAAKVHERFAAYTRSEVPATGDGWVVGVPASPGRATGPVRIVTSADQFDLVEPGDVLVAPLTAPAWTPLFARVSAVVTDGGSLAAHASLIAREYGIPAVVATGNATKVLGDGMVVTVDGSQGTIAPA